jgi:uncharacterized phage-associated protein
MVAEHEGVTQFCCWTAVSAGTGTVGIDVDRSGRRDAAMASAHDVAAYVLRERGPMSAMKLQKLVYYSQAWHLAWESEPLFREHIEAWANGPVVYELFDAHRGRYTVGPDWPDGDADALTDVQREIVDEVLDAYGDMTARQLSVLSHSEQPWQVAREGLAPFERGSNRIDPTVMIDYYGALLDSEDSEPVRASRVPED